MNTRMGGLDECYTLLIHNYYQPCGQNR